MRKLVYTLLILVGLGFAVSSCEETNIVPVSEEPVFETGDGDDSSKGGGPS